MDKYKSLYGDLKFEREGLFQLMQESYACRDVLYPGCSIHITPSIYFPHVVYVDQSQAAARFFADEDSLREFLSRNKRYKQSAYFRFIPQDYSTPLPLMDDSFDLLLALFAEGISKSCTRYLRVGGTLLTNNHRGDGLDAARDDRLVFQSTIRFRKGKYRIEKESPDLGNIHAQKLSSKSLQQVSQGMVYVENETYYVFKRSH